MNDMSKHSVLLPEAVQIDIENTERQSDVQALKWKKDSRGS
jgi:hypothetical protein